VARSRNIKPSLFKNEVLGVADPLYTILFEGLWVLADREGRLEDRPLRIKAEVFPYRDKIDMGKMLDWLQTNGFIARYQVAGKGYVQILSFAKHQNPHKNEAESELPAYIASSSEEIGTSTEFIGSTRADSLSSDSLSSDSLDSGLAQKAQTPPPAYLGEQNESEIPDKARVPLASGWELPAGWGQDAEALGWKPEEILRESEKFRQYYVSGKGAGTRRGIKGWRQSWSNWLANAEKFTPIRRIA